MAAIDKATDIDAMTKDDIIDCAWGDYAVIVEGSRVRFHADEKDADHWFAFTEEGIYVAEFDEEKQTLEEIKANIIEGVRNIESAKTAGSV